jgi:hypothetical protein
MAKMTTAEMIKHLTENGFTVFAHEDLVTVTHHVHVEDCDCGKCNDERRAELGRYNAKAMVCQQVFDDHLTVGVKKDVEFQGLETNQYTASITFVRQTALVKAN